MSESIIRILAGIVVISFVSAFLTLTTPGSNGGRLARNLCIANAAGWIVILLLPDEGHPPLWLIPGILFWLTNLVLLPAAAFSLRSSYKDREEKTPFLAVASSYIAINLAVFFVIPLVWLLRAL